MVVDEGEPAGSTTLGAATVVRTRKTTLGGGLNSGLVQNSVSSTPYVLPSKKEYEILFQQLFDEYFNPPPSVVCLVLTTVAAPRVVDPAGSPSSTTIDQDLTFASTSPRTQEIQS
nr:hypothetical protein [Tanacetum cinerariifolium]